MLPPVDTEYMNLIGREVFIKEFRTIKLSAPRRSGKTRAMAKLASLYSSLVVVPNRVMVDIYRKDYNIFSINSIESFIYSSIGIYGKGLKYRCILVDECYRIDLSPLIAHLRMCNMIEEDFFILMVGTDR